MLRKKFEIKVEFFDVDSINVVWHGNYIKYLEISRCRFLEEIGYDYLQMDKDGFVFPIIKLDCKYIAPAFFGDTIEIEVILKEFETFLTFEYIITNLKTNQKLSIAHTTQACINKQTHQTCFELPKEFVQKIKGAIK